MADQARRSVHLQLPRHRQRCCSNQLRRRLQPVGSRERWLPLVSLLVTLGPAPKTSGMTPTYPIWLSPTCWVPAVFPRPQDTCLWSWPHQTLCFSQFPGAPDVVSPLHQEMELEGTFKTLWLDYIPSCPPTFRAQGQQLEHLLPVLCVFLNFVSSVTFHQP